VDVLSGSSPGLVDGNRGGDVPLPRIRVRVGSMRARVAHQIIVMELFHTNARRSSDPMHLGSDDGVPRQQNDFCISMCRGEPVARLKIQLCFLVTYLVPFIDDTDIQ
jgi:hypothetical protein